LEQPITPQRPATKKLPEPKQEFSDWGAISLKARRVLVLSDIHAPYFDKAALELANVQTELAALRSQETTGSAPGGDTGAFLGVQQERLNRALLSEGYQPGDLVFYLDESGQLAVRAVLPALERPNTPRGISAPGEAAFVIADALGLAAPTIGNAVQRLEQRAAELEAIINAAPSAPPGGPPPGEQPPGQPPGEPPRTVLSVFNDIEAAGAASVRLAAALGTEEANLDSLRERSGLVEAALRELLTDFAGVVTPEQVAFLVARSEALNRDIERVQLNIERRTGPASNIAAIPDNAPLNLADRALASRLLGSISDTAP